jgi:AcrR family transcriptional regulator
MSVSSIDRRAVRTRGAIHRAFAALALHRSYDAIRVDDICSQAGVGRSTFYAHYAGKDDLLRRAFDHLRRALAAARSAGQARPFAWVEALFAHAAGRHSHLCLFAGGRRAEIARTELRAILGAELRRDLAGISLPEELSPRVAMGTAALLALFEWWLADGAQRPPAEMAALFCRTVADRVIAG